MRFGCCIDPQLIGAAAAAGYDYVELPVAAVLPERPEPDFHRVREALLAAPLRPEAWHSLLPPDMAVTGPSVDWPRVARYVYTALRRIAEVGGAVVSFGSGASRQVAEGFPLSEAFDQLTEALRVCGASARSRALMVAIEPLSVTRCNIINSLPEAVELARAVDMPEVGVLPHALHMALDGHSPLDVVDAAAWLAHVRVPGPEGAAPWDGDWARDFLAALRMADYDWRISVQSDWQDAATEMGVALALLAQHFEETESLAHGAHS